MWVKTIETLDLNVLFDYLTLSFPVDETEKNIRDELSQGIPDVTQMFHNKHFINLIELLGFNRYSFTDDGKIPHYDKMLTFGEHVQVKFNGAQNKYGINTHSLELKGDGCREVESLGVNWHKVFEYIHDNNLNVSTLHLACDVFTDKYFTMAQLVKKTELHQFKSFSRKQRIIKAKDSSDDNGTSLYFGNRDDNQLNIYDKKAERYYKGYSIDTNLWIRFEIRLKARKSHDVVRLINALGVEDLPKIWFGIIQDFITFKSKTPKDLHNPRWQHINIWRNWERFLKSYQHIKIKNQAQLESSITKKKHWLIDSAGKSLLEFLGSSDEIEQQEFFEKIVTDKVGKLDNKSLTRINAYRKNKDLEPFNNVDELHEYIDTKWVLSRSDDNRE